MTTINYDLKNLVSTHRGAWPVIITCPHDGKEKPADVPERDDRPAIKKKSDLHTINIAKGIAQSLFDTAGKDPYVVIAEFGREFIDANREPPKKFPPDPDEKCGFDVEEARIYYREYHRKIRSFADEIREGNNGIGLLLDIHGAQVKEEDPADIYLGTDNGYTITRLLGNHPNAMWEDGSLRSSLNVAGYIISPTQVNSREVTSLDGGYTVKRYGSHKQEGIDAIQMEITAHLRMDKDRRNALIQDLASAIDRFISEFFI